VVAVEEIKVVVQDLLEDLVVVAEAHLVLEEQETHLQQIHLKEIQVVLQVQDTQ
jgi:hypothetical protein